MALFYCCRILHISKQPTGAGEHFQKAGFGNGDRGPPMILYLDTSALIKRYFREPFSGAVLSKWTDAEAIVTFAVTYAETMACFDDRLNRAAQMDGLPAF